MLDHKKQIEYKNKEYPLLFSTNVMVELQNKYSSFSAWAELVSREDGTQEPDMNALRDFYYYCINEGIDEENEEADIKRQPISINQAGRIMSAQLNPDQIAKDTIVKSVSSGEVEDSEKNVMTTQNQ